MLLGTPCVAADVGGVVDLMTLDQEGIVYPSDEPYMLAHGIRQIFALEDRAETMGKAAKAHASRTHDPEENLKTLLKIYESLK